MASRGKRGAGERVLEGRHVIGLFMLMLVFSGVFFTLGYVMGRNQYNGQVSAETAVRPAINEADTMRGKAVAVPKGSVRSTEGAASSDWDAASSEKTKTADEHFKTAAPVNPQARSGTQNSSAGNGGRGVIATQDSPKASQVSGTYMLQVSAVRRESDAFELARRLQRKKFPAFVLSPQGNKFYRVEVGPYADQKAAEAAKKGLENAGFRAIVKRG
jgi:cell division septation protein DedD